MINSLTSTNSSMLGVVWVSDDGRFYIVRRYSRIDGYYLSLYERRALILDKFHKMVIGGDIVALQTHIIGINNVRENENKLKRNIVSKMFRKAFIEKPSTEVSLPEYKTLANAVDDTGEIFVPDADFKKNQRNTNF